MFDPTPLSYYKTYMELRNDSAAVLSTKTLGGRPQNVPNAIILTSGLSGSSVLAGLLARSGYWAGDSTVQKDYDTFENSDLVKLNTKLLAEAQFTGNYTKEFSPEAIRAVSALCSRIDEQPYRAFIDDCNAHAPWVWKDPRLWMTIRFWANLLPLRNCRFLLLTRDHTHAWVSCTLRRHIQTLRHLKQYELSIERAIRSFLNTYGLPFLHLKYEEMIRNPERTLEQLNSHLGSDLTVRDLAGVYKGKLFKSPRGSALDYAKTFMIYVKNYSERMDTAPSRALTDRETPRPLNKSAQALPSGGLARDGAEADSASRSRSEFPGFTIWLTGLSGVGKSTISKLLVERLRAEGRRVELLDGHEFRRHLSKGLGFTKEERDENIRRIGFVCELLSRNGVIAVVAAISPYRSTREEIRARVNSFFEIYVHCPLDVLVARDVKGLYKRAIAGQLPHFTGVSDPYEPPTNPDVAVNSSVQTPAESADQIWAALQGRGLI